MRVGCDIVCISRIEKIHTRHGKNFLDKFLSPQEQILVKNPATLAGLWAAKEAASKALGLGICELCTFFDIQISKDKRNAPKLQYSQKLIHDFNIQESSLSISHDNGFAIAIVAII
ncbi:holo-ACP synthase [Campylobacter hepaticus]|uniref:Holo-[acyl-carrier-protein] synthase n=1 Tax=Campylobacter hepaticus TaxID=1813019 RepID=A0A424YZU2_9BACT|nr:holo-ACP synthase [Campylobacter hepaticus]AXP09017.1 holo-ACP synthase [Campylobacter hepaticus]MCZ0771942.1 holo-ACP synthase [Campylobacter hepaticus]MCZ0773411.1 holo-ACP synthase [Campylobacter hepaticus]MCZ0774661.1 holo-ACP synthase [Campylobacter hepaticus]MDX2323723.1 holo-ACP synthase [Campylobacter hepaticus]